MAKTFQARVWRDCQARWRALDAGARHLVEALLPVNHGLDASA